MFKKISRFLNCLKTSVFYYFSLELIKNFACLMHEVLKVIFKEIPVFPNCLTNTNLHKNVSQATFLTFSTQHASFIAEQIIRESQSLSAPSPFTARCSTRLQTQQLHCFWHSMLLLLQPLLALLKFCGQQQQRCTVAQYN